MYDEFREVSCSATGFPKEPPESLDQSQWTSQKHDGDRALKNRMMQSRWIWSRVSRRPRTEKVCPCVSKLQSNIELIHQYIKKTYQFEFSLSILFHR